MPSVSVVVPVYNGAAYLQQALDSALQQPGADVELVVVDDGSTDETPRILDRYRGRITALRQDNAGMGAARNAGIGVARGEFIAFVDSDDYWLDGKLAAQLALFARRPGVGLVFCNARFEDDGVLLARTSFDVCRPHRGRVYERLLVDSFIPMPSVVVRRTCFDEVGLFDPRLLISADFDLWLRIAARYEVDYVDAPLVVYRRHGGNITRNVEASLREGLDITAAHARAAGLASTRAVRRRLGSLESQLGMARLDRGDPAGARKAFVHSLRLEPRALRPYVGYALSVVGGRTAVPLFRRAARALRPRVTSAGRR